MTEHIAAKLLCHTLCLGSKVALKLVGKNVAISCLKLCIYVSKLHSGERKAGNDNLVLGTIKLNDLVTVLLLNLCKSIGKKLLLHLHNVLKGVNVGEFKVKACELGSMLVGIGLLCSEYRACLEDSLKTGSHSHLLIELRGLSKVCKSVKILNLENVGAGLARCSDKLGSMDLNKVTLYKELTHSVSECSLHSIHKLVLLTTEIDPSVIHTHVDIRVILNRKRVCDRLNSHKGGVHFLTAHLNVLACNNLTLEGYNRVNGKLVKHLGKFRMLFLLNSDLELTRNVSYNDKRHCSLVTEVLNESLYTAHAGSNVFNISSFHFLNPFYVKFYL